MPEATSVVKRVDLVDDLPSVERIKLLLKARGFRSVAAWARSRRFGETDVWHAITGRRPNAQRTKVILDALAEDVGKPRDVIEKLVAA